MHLLQSLQQLKQNQNGFVGQIEFQALVSKRRRAGYGREKGALSFLSRNPFVADPARRLPAFCSYFTHWPRDGNRLKKLKLNEANSSNSGSLKIVLGKTSRNFWVLMSGEPVLETRILRLWKNSFPRKPLVISVFLSRPYLESRLTKNAFNINIRSLDIKAMLIG